MDEQIDRYFELLAAIVEQARADVATSARTSRHGGGARPTPTEQQEAEAFLAAIGIAATAKKKEHVP